MNSSAISVGIDDYLDEALGGEDDESEDDANTSHLSLGVSIYDNLLKGHFLNLFSLNTEQRNHRLQ